jgi:hypothetical protein
MSSSQSASLLSLHSRLSIRLCGAHRKALEQHIRHFIASFLKVKGLKSFYTLAPFSALFYAHLRT